MKSASSSPGSPPVRNGYTEGLYAKWQLTDSSRLRTPLSKNGRGGLARDDSTEDVDDDIFGSGAWRRQRKKRAKAKEEGQTENGKSPHKNGVPTYAWLRMIQKSLQQLKVTINSSLPTSALSLSRRLSQSVTAEDKKRMTVTAANGLPPRPRAVNGGYELTTECLVQEARLLCSNYIYQRLSAKGLWNKRVKASAYESPLAEEIYSAGQELERLYPRTYTDISRRIAMTMTSAQIVRRALTSVLDGIFSTGISWAKVVSMMAIAGAFAEECVVQGHPNFVEDVVMCVGHFVTMHLTIWLAQQGGWAAFPKPKKQEEEATTEGSLVLAVVIIFCVTAVVLFVIFKIFWDGCDVSSVHR